jgi:nitrogen regulatory protein P-II 2
MKLITAVIQPRMLERLASALRKAKVPGITVVEAKGFGRETFLSDWDRAGYLTPKTKVELAVNDDQVEEIVQLIQRTVTTGKSGDGIIFVSELLASVRIGSGESGDVALT